MAPPTRVVRIKKLSKSQGQTILREDQIEDYDSLQSQYTVDTGVEKSEEKEFHLQAALANSSKGESEGEIPAPPADETPNFDYDGFYARKFDKTATYIRFSQTVEESIGCQYDMLTEDDVFLKEYNRKKSASSKVSEDDFEAIFDFFEQAARQRTPHAAVSKTVLEWEAIEQLFDTHHIETLLEPKLRATAQIFFPFWKTRRIEADYNSLQPKLKAEIAEDKDDSDPYVCFRRREMRQTRKTRARDVQSTEKLKRLRKELEEGRSIVKLVLNRELAKRELMKVEKEIFESRSELKAIKIKTGIKGEDDGLLLINQKPQKRKVSEFPGFSRPPGQQLRLQGRSDGRPLDADLVLLSDLKAQKENMLQSEISEKSKQHDVWNAGFVDLTREPLSPVTSGTDFRNATAQYQLPTPPSSVNSDALDHPSPAQEKFERSTVRYASPPEDDEHRGQPAYRKRIGRNNRLWIDRRGLPLATLPSAVRGGHGLVSDRWKYDQDDDDEQPVYEMDPYDTMALRFRSTIPFPPNLVPQRVRQEAVQGRTNGASPTNNRSIAAAPQPTPT